MAALLLVFLALVPSGLPGQTVARPRLSRPPAVVQPQPERIPVPELVGRDVKEAAQLVDRRRLRLGQLTRRSSGKPPGTVIGQEPTAGTMVEPDTPVHLVIAVQRRPSRAVVPPLIDHSLPEAREILAEARLTMGEVQELPSERPAGRVVRQSPAPGVEVDPGSPVNLWLAAPVETPGFVVPSVLGHTREEAEKILAEAGLQPGSVTSQDSARPPGTVIEQRPAAGARLAEAVPVDLVLAAGVAPTLIPVPDLTGLTREQAEAVLARSRLLMGRVDGLTSDSQSGLVLEQQPPAGTQVPPGTPVNLVVSKSSLLPAIAGGALALLALLGGSYVVMKKKAGLPSSVELRPYRDTGSPSVEPGAGHLVEPEIRVRPVADRGEQRLEGEVIPE